MTKNAMQFLKLDFFGSIFNFQLQTLYCIKNYNYFLKRLGKNNLFKIVEVN